MKRVVLIDGSSYIYRAFYALPSLTSPKGEPTGAIYGFIRMISKLLKELQPEYIAVAFDYPGKTFRHEEYKEYKATRKETPDELKAQIPKIKQILKLWGIKVIEIPGYEADDIIATLAKKAVEKGFEVIIVTPDKDMLQLVNDKIKVLNPVNDELFDKDKIKEKYGIYPEQFVDFLTLIGDKVDNLIGVHGIGTKTAQKLLNQYKDIEEIYKNLDKLKEKQKKSFEEAKERINLNKKLIQLKTDTPLDMEIEELKKEKTDMTNLKEMFHNLGFKSLKIEEEKKENQIKQGRLF
ncbi:MAG: 5'-3' exonuclease [Aquificae bacterium]|nr:5'-3' exonuclease [Aquificota bacterium]